MTATLTVAAVLGDGDEVQAGIGLEHRLARSNTAETTLGPLATPTYRVLDQRVAEALRSLLQVDVGEVLLEGWRSLRELVAAGERTRGTPGQPEDVVLAKHVITYTQQPVVEVRLDGQPVATLAFDLALSLAVVSVVAVVDGGSLVALRSGDVDAEAVLSLRGVELARGAVAVAVGAALRLGSGVPLVAPPPPAVPNQTATPSWERIGPTRQPRT